MRQLIAVAVILVLAGALMGGSCKVRTDTPDSLANPPESVRETAPEREVPKPLDVGDAEASLSFALSVPQPIPQNVAVEELRNLRGDLDMTTANVAPPHPPQFPLELTVTSKKAFAERPLLVRISVLRDKQPIETQTATLAGDANKKPFAFTFDALKGLPQPPQTLLIHAEAEIIMLPAGTDISTVDPATVTGTPETTGAKISNPVRINFVADGAAAAGGAATAGGAG